MQIDSTTVFPVNIHEITEAVHLHYLVRQAAEYVQISGYMQVGRFLEVMSMYELITVADWFSKMPRDILDNEEPTPGVSNAMALAVVLQIGEGDPRLTLNKILRVSQNILKFACIEMELRQLNLMDNISDIRNTFSVLEGVE